MSIAFSRSAWYGVILATHTTDRPLALRIERLLIEDRTARPVCELPHPLVDAVMVAYRRFDRTYLSGALAGGKVAS